MFPKKNRADTNAVAGIFRAGKRINSNNLSFRFLFIKNQRTPRISFITPKSVSKKALDRNRLRRRGYHVLRNHISNLPASLSGVFVFGQRSMEYFGKKNQTTAARKIILQNLEDEIKKIINTLH